MFMTKLLRQLNQFVSSFDNVSSLVTLSFFEAELMEWHPIVSVHLLC